MRVENLTLIQMKDFAIVAVAILGLIVLVGNVIKTIRTWRAPHMSTEQRIQQVEEKLDNDNKRIESLEEGNKAICRGVLALLSHAINGDSMDKLLKAQEGLSEYLIER